MYEADLTEDEQDLAFVYISSLNDYKTYEQYQHYLEHRKKPLDQIVNPSATDINNHLKAVQK